MFKNKSTAPDPLPEGSLLFSRIKTEGELMLLQLDDWYRARDGVNYKHIWGRVRIRAAKDILGFEPRQMTNFVYQIGDGAEAIFVMGCRVHYAQICLDPPSRPDTLFAGLS